MILIILATRLSGVCENAAIGFQPEGLADSSRWSQRSADHRKGNAYVVRTPEGVPPFF